MTRQADSRRERSAARSRRLLFACLALCVLGLGAGLAVFGGGFDPQRMRGLVCGDGAWSGLAVIVLMVAHCFVPFPAELVAIAAGACMGFWPGFAAVWIGAMLGAALSFWLARTLGWPFVEEMLPGRARAWLDDWTRDQGAATLLISRFLPVIAFNLINYAAGLTSVRPAVFLWTTGLGIAPITALSVWAGAMMRDLSPVSLAILCVAGVAAIGFGHWLGRLRRRVRAAMAADAGGERPYAAPPRAAGGAMSIPIRGVLFDKDGTLFDFHATWRGVAQAVIARLAPGDPDAQARLGEAVGFDLSTGRFTPGSVIVAGSTGEIAETWAAMIPGGDAAAIEETINDASLAADGATLVPAAEDMPALLDRLRGMGLALGVATHDSEAAARSNLAACGAADRFDFFAGYDSGHGLKPGPGMIEAFARTAGLDAEEVAMVGDSLHDLLAGRAAGAGLRIGVLTGPAGEEMLAPHADAVLGSIAELPEFLAPRIRPDA